MSVGAWDVVLRVLTLVALVSALVGLVRWGVNSVRRSRRRSARFEARGGSKSPHDEHTAT